ncbi:MAG: ABC transporter substrate-binding protein [Acidimicrobiales bacterium]
MKRATKGIRTAAVALAALMVAAGCGSSSTKANSTTPRPGKTALAANQMLRLAVATMPRSLDPALASSSLFPHLYSEALLAINPAGNNVVPAAAKSFGVSPNGLTYTFHLRNNGFFSNGQPVTAQDFVYAWRHLIDPRVAAPRGRLFAHQVKGGAQVASLDPKTAGPAIDAGLANLGLKAVNNKTFQVTLAQPSLDFKWIATLIDGAPVLKSAVSANSAWATSPATLITNGVFHVSAINAGQSITLVPNSHYRAQPLLKTIVVSKATAAAEWTKYLNNEAEIAYPPEPLLHAASVDPTLAKQIISFPIPSVEWTTFNTTKAPFNNPKVRAAFAEAM